MNIGDIMHQTQKTAFGAGNAFQKNSFLSIGKKGQTVEGVISGVSDRISINFNGIEVSVPHSAVQDAREGETRKFQIMDVSKENIVLKEVGRTESSVENRARVNTTCNNSSSYGNILPNDSAKANLEGQEAGKNLAILTGDDYQQIEGENNLDKLSKEHVEREVERIKRQKEFVAGNELKNMEFSEELKQDLEKIQSMGFISQKSEAQIEQLLRDADIPVTNENLSHVVSALTMSMHANHMTDDAKAYIIGQELVPTIENIYHGIYSGCDAEDGTIYDEETWESLQAQIEDIIKISGLDRDSALKNAKWLFANDMPLNIQNLNKMAVLDNIQKGISVDDILKQIIQAMSAGNKAEQASLDTSEFVIARSIINDFMAVDDNVIVKAVNYNLSYDAHSSHEEMELNLELLREIMSGEQNNDKQRQDIVIPGVITDGMTEVDIQAVIAKRNIAEICLKMTVQSVSIMNAKGIDVQTEPLQNIVNELRDIENRYYRVQSGEFEDITDNEFELMHEAIKKTSDIANAPASLIGSSVRQMNLLTLNRLHAAAISENAKRQDFLNVYERVSTQVSAEYGDSIEKAFKGIPKILGSLGLEDTNANERAVRILGYSSMNITEDNINSVKQYDATLNRVINNMKPSVVLELIRNGSNPLYKTIEELDRELSDIVNKRDITSEDKYSRYLWQLERDNGITEQERAGYIGVYRLLNNIEKTDGAAIGAVLQTNRDMTLGNLLSAVRTIKGNGVDAKIDENFGGLEDIVYKAQSISQQINQGFGADISDSSSNQNNNRNPENRSPENSSPVSRTENYYSELISESIDEISPSKINEISDGDMEKLLDLTVEKFAEELKMAGGKKEIEKAYYDNKAEVLRSLVRNDEEAVQFLQNLAIEPTIENLTIVNQIMQNGYNTLKQCYNRRDVLDEKEKQEFENIIDELPEALDSEESIDEKCQSAEKYMREILNRSYEKPDVTSDELSNLKMLAQGIHLNSMRVTRRSYEIPVKTGDTVTNMSVTILNGQEDKGKVQIAFDKDKQDEAFAAFGNINTEFKISGKDIKGLILCESRTQLDELKKRDALLREQFETNGFSVKNISYVMQGSVRNSGINEKVDNIDADATDLYRTAKIMVRHLSELIKGI